MGLERQGVAPRWYVVTPFAPWVTAETGPGCRRVVRPAGDDVQP